MWLDHLALVEQCQLARYFEDTLNDEHHVRAASVVFIEHQGNVVLQCSRQNAITELSNLLAVFQDDCIFTDQIDSADVTVEVNTDARLVEARGNLLDVP